MGLFNRAPYPGGYGGGYGAPMRRGSGLRKLLLILGIIFGLYFLNIAFLWVKIPAISVSTLKFFNIVTGILLIILGLTAVIRPRPY